MPDTFDIVLDRYPQRSKVGVSRLIKRFFFLLELLLFFVDTLLQLTILLHSAPGQLKQHLFVEHFPLLGDIMLNGLVGVDEPLRGGREVPMFEITGAPILANYLTY